MATPRNARPGMLLDPSASINNGLVGWWPMWEGAGGKTLDISGNNNHGELKNGPLWAGGVLRLDGVNDYVNVPSGLADLSGLVASVSARIRLNAYSANGAVFFGTNTGTSAYWMVGSNNTTVYIQGGAAVTVPSTTFADGTWRDIVMTSRSGLQSIYVNGRLLASAAQSGVTIATGAKAFAIGDWIGGLGSSWRCNGDITNLRAWNREISAPEVQHLYVNPNIGLWAPDTVRYYFPAAGGSVAAADGTSTVSAVGSSVSAAGATSAGASTVAGAGGSVAAATPASAGTSTVSAVGASGAAATPSSAGTSAVAGVGASLAAGAASSAGTSTAAATSPSGGSDAVSAGTSTVSATGASTARADALAAGAGTASAAGGAVAAGAVISTGTSSVAAVGAAIARAVAQSAGTSATGAAGASAASAAANAAGSSTAAAISNAVAIESYVVQFRIPADARSFRIPADARSFKILRAA